MVAVVLLAVAAGLLVWSVFLIVQDNHWASAEDKRLSQSLIMTRILALSIAIGLFFFSRVLQRSLLLLQTRPIV